MRINNFLLAVWIAATGFGALTLRNQDREISMLRGKIAIYEAQMTLLREQENKSPALTSSQWLAKQKQEASTDSDPFVEASYIGNANSRKFHRPDCSAVSRMNPDNEVNLGGRDEAIEEGYVPCKKCNP